MKKHQKHAVWDLAVRGIHWCFPLGVATLWWTGEQGMMDVHSKTGYFMLVIVVSRFVWGFLGSHHALFRHFLAGPRTVLAYIRAPYATVGHNPLGGWSTLLLLLLLLVQGVSGLFTSDDILFDGPLNYWGGQASLLLAEIHGVNWRMLQFMMVLHLGAVIFYQFFRGQPLIQAMWRGSAPGKTSIQATRSAAWIVPVIVSVALVLWAIVRNAPQAPTYW